MRDDSPACYPWLIDNFVTRGGGRTDQFSTQWFYVLIERHKSREIFDELQGIKMLLSNFNLSLAQWYVN